MQSQKKYNQCVETCACGDCPQAGMCAAWTAYIDKHAEARNYAHFDKRVSLGMDFVRKYVMNEAKVAAHGFYPFIHFTVKNSRYGKKGPKKPRELYYCSHMDRSVYQRYAFLLNYYYNIHTKEKGIHKAAIAYRDNLGKNNIDFARDAFDAIRGSGQSLIIVGDFTSFFDKLDHSYLKQRMCELLGVDCLPRDYYAVFRNITHFSSMDWEDVVKAAGENINSPGVKRRLNEKKTILTRKQFLDNKGLISKNVSGVGIPQGSPVSAVLANVYMLKFDEAINGYVSGKGGLYMRYSDDFLIMIPLATENDIKEHVDYIFSYINTLQGVVELQEEKTSLFLFKNDSIISYPSEEPAVIDYLGFLFDGRDTRMRPRSITKYYYRMRRKARTVRRSREASPHVKHVTARNLYQIYANNGRRPTFIGYAKKSARILGLRDPETEAVIRKHKQKIAQALKGDGLQ